MVPAANYTVDLASSLLTFSVPPAQNVIVTYVSGSTIVPANVRQATRVLVKHMWQVDKQDLRNRSNPEMGWTQTGFAVPKRVLEMLAPSTRKVGFA